MTLPSPPFNAFDWCDDAGIDPFAIVLSLPWLGVLGMIGLSPWFFWMVWDRHGETNTVWNAAMVGVIAQTFYAGLFLVWLVSGIDGLLNVFAIAVVLALVFAIIGYQTVGPRP